MKKMLPLLLGVPLFIIIIGVTTNKLQNRPIFGPAFPVTSPSPDSLKTVTVGSKEVKVRVADTDSERRMGLSGTKSLAEDEGVLFVFDKKDIAPAFWMKDMFISIDIIWINDGTIIQIDRNIPPPPAGTSDKDLKLYSPSSPIDYVLEVNGGWSDKYSVYPGDKVSL